LGTGLGFSTFGAGVGRGSDFGFSGFGATVAFGAADISVFASTHGPEGLNFAWMLSFDEGAGFGACGFAGFGAGVGVGFSTFALRASVDEVLGTEAIRAFESTLGAGGLKRVCSTIFDDGTGLGAGGVAGFGAGLGSSVFGVDVGFGASVPVVPIPVVPVVPVAGVATTAGLLSVRLAADPRPWVSTCCGFVVLNTVVVPSMTVARTT
jgi:hypothetical protein